MFNQFSKSRFPKLSLVLSIISTLLMITLPIHFFLGGTFTLPADTTSIQITILYIVITVAASMLLSVLLWLLLRKKGIRIIDLLYPVCELVIIVIWVCFHIFLFS